MKNLVKLAGGEYIALEKLESIYKSCPLVGNLCVHADATANRPMAVVFVHEKNLSLACEELSIGASGRSISQLCHDPEVEKLVLKELWATGRKAGFKPLEVSGPSFISCSLKRYKSLIFCNPLINVLFFSCCNLSS
jgi:long-chain acyl-CoA synthetase